ncbi:MAG: hypothetical protein ACK5X3_03800 [Pseudomonadota bacterium]
MDSKELSKIVQQIDDHFEGLKRVELQALVESVRLYPDGFEFSRNIGERVERFRIVSAFISGADITLDARIFYRCKVSAWNSWSGHSSPISETAITSFVKRFSQEA